MGGAEDEGLAGRATLPVRPANRPDEDSTEKAANIAAAVGAAASAAAADPNSTRAFLRGDPAADLLLPPPAEPGGFTTESPDAATETRPATTRATGTSRPSSKTGLRRTPTTAGRRRAAGATRWRLGTIAGLAVLVLVGVAGSYAWNLIRDRTGGLATQATRQTEAAQDRPVDDRPADERPAAEGPADDQAMGSTAGSAAPELATASTPGSEATPSASQREQVTAPPVPAAPGRAEPTHKEPGRTSALEGAGSSNDARRSNLADRPPRSGGVSSSGDAVADLGVPEEVMGPAEGTNVERFSGPAAQGRLTSSDIMSLETVPVDDRSYTRSRALLVMNAQRNGDTTATKRYLDELMLLPENQYNPIYLSDLGTWYLNNQQYDLALQEATLAERYWARLPPELVFSRKAEIYETQASAWQGQFNQSDDDLEMLDQAIRYWQKYRDHVQTRSRSDLVGKADAQLAKLEDIKRRLN